MVVSKEVFTIQKYCDKVLGFCPLVVGNENELRNILDNEGREDLWDYPLNEIEHIIENGINVVLVDTTYVNDDMNLVEEYRWFQVPDGWEEKYGKAKN